MAATVSVSSLERPRVPDPESKPQRRRFPTEYKLRILREIDAASEPGEIGEILRREGLYSQIISVWRRQRDEGALEALGKRKRGPKGSDPVVAENRRQAGRIAALEAEVAELRELTEAQGNVSALLGNMFRKSAKPSTDG